MNRYDYVIIACGGLEGGDFSITFEDADEAFSYAEKLENDNYVTAWSIKRVLKGTWQGKGPGDCPRVDTN